MANSYKTPGVFVEEIPKFPPSVAEVETAIPAFVGYTQTAIRNGEPLTNVPVKITSLLEFSNYFGGPLTPQVIEVVVNPAKNYEVTKVTVDGGKRFYLYDSVRMFYDNGGGPCYIVSVGSYLTGAGAVQAVVAGEEANALTKPGLRVGIDRLEKVDEPTMLLFPDAVSLTEDAMTGVQQMAIMQAAKLQDRVAILDLKENGTGNFAETVTAFRNNIGMAGLKYAAAYGPWIYSSFTKDVDFGVFSGNIKDGTNAAVDLATTTADVTVNGLITGMKAATADADAVVKTVGTILRAKADGTLGADADAVMAPSVRDRMKIYSGLIGTAGTAAEIKAALKTLITFATNVATGLRTSWTGANFFGSKQMKNEVTTYGGSESLWRGGVKGLIETTVNPNVGTLIGAASVTAIMGGYTSVGNPWLGIDPTTIPTNGKDYTANSATDKTQAMLIASDITAAFEKIAAFTDTVTASASSYKKAAQDALYEAHPVVSNIVKSIKRELAKLPPSGAVAGIYARVDNARGVWKAPANESINSVTGPVYAISNDEQAGLNVDPVAGKSINAIRSFTGRGTLVWGARTLAGNDNEWRYVSVRRFFNMVEESTRKASERFVFESNDANTWVKVQGMIENFLTTQWRNGALQGAKPDHAFYVAVGLGKTMTALDILEGRMIIEIGMAVVRPAEFIILRFSHKMAQS